MFGWLLTLVMRSNTTQLALRCSKVGGEFRSTVFKDDPASSHTLALLGSSGEPFPQRTSHSKEPLPATAWEFCMLYKILQQH